MQYLETAATRLRDLPAKARWIAALSLGLLYTLAFAPTFWIVLIVPALTGVFWLLQGAQSARQAFFTGWWFGFGHHVSGLYWMAYSLLVEPEKHAILIPFAVSLIPAVLAVYIGLVTTATWKLRARPAWQSVMLFATFWVAAEWARAYLFTGFPWNLAGYVWAFSDTMLQPAALAGVYGLSLLTLLAGASWATLTETGGGFRRYCLPVFSAALLVFAYVGGTVRLAFAPPAFMPEITLRIVQGNIEQHHKWDPAVRAQTVQTYIAASQATRATVTPEAPPRTSPAAPTHILWPETAMPYLLNEAPDVLAAIAPVIPDGGLLMTGALRSAGERTAFWNSLFAIGANGEIVAVYDKAHLVPFGEYVPFREWLPITRITAGTGDFDRGPGPLTLQLPGLPPVAPQVCYEGIFPHFQSTEPVQPEWIFNITNDAWFGDSGGPHQHFHMTRLRAVEQGIPVVRAANTGISGVIDAFGRVIASLPLNTQGVIDSPLPAATARTPFGQYGPVIVSLLLLMSLATGLIKFNE